VVPARQNHAALRAGSAAAAAQREDPPSVAGEAIFFAPVVSSATPARQVTKTRIDLVAM